MAKNSGPVRTVHERTYGVERDKMVEVTKAEIEKKFGTGSIMRYGDGGPQLEVEAIPTGSLALDAAFMVPSLLVRPPFLLRFLQRLKLPAVSLHSSMPSTLWTPPMPPVLESISTKS